MNVSVKHISLSLAAAALFALSGCKNSDITFDDFEYTSAYFANQWPLRTLVMGQDFDMNTDLDNQHKCKIGATMGGSYTGRDVTLGIAVDNSLCDNLYFDDAFQNPVKPMPSNYYELSSQQISYNGAKTGYVEVTFSDAFFADEDAVKATYVIPLRITSFSGVDKLIEGEYDTESLSSAPSLTNSDAWMKLPQNFTLYCVKFMSKYAGWFLRRGVDNINGTEVKREFKNEYQIEDQVVNITTNGLLKVSLDVVYLIDNVETTFTVVMTFDEKSQKCDISSGTPGVTITGSGQYVDGGAGKYWGDRLRDQLTLEYTINDGTNKISTKDTLVTQRRGVRTEDFPHYYKSSK